MTETMNDAPRGVLLMNMMCRPEPKTIIVAGLGRGREIPAFRNLYPDAKIVGYEPLKKFCKKPSSMLDEVHQCALGEKRCERDLLTSYRADTRATFNELLVPLEDGGRVSVKVITLDDALKDREPPVLLWLDTQGSEYRILEPSKLLTPKFAPWLNVELNCCPVRDGCLMTEVDGLLFSRGYRMVGMHSGDTTEMDGVYVAKEIWDSIRLEKAKSSHARKIELRKIRKQGRRRR